MESKGAIVSIDESYLLGRLPDSEDGTETQEEVNEESLNLHNQRDLLDQISSKTVSRWEIKFLVDEVREADGIFWAVCLKEIIQVYGLTTLKMFLDDELSKDKINEVSELLLFLKFYLPDRIIDKKLPYSREDMITYMEKAKAPHYIIFALQTIDRDSFGRFKRCFDYDESVVH